METFKKAKSILEDYPDDWPPKEFFFHKFFSDLSPVNEFEKLIKSSPGETAIDNFIRDHPSVLAMALEPLSTGHHGAWVIPQQVIRPKINENTPGLIPDYILGGNSSDGFTWWVVELKGADVNLFSKRKNELCFSPTLNKGICKLLTYIDYCAEIQSTLRDTFKLKDFREPKGLLLMGREDELINDSQKQKLKAAWNRITRSKLEIRSYDSLLRSYNL